MEGNGNFGEWITDQEGLPAYLYKSNQFTNSIAKTPTTYGYSVDHFHQIGNDRITATVHNGGYIQVLDSSRGFQWLTYFNEKQKKFGGGIGLFQLEKSQEVHLDLYSSNKPIKRTFGVGYFRKEFNVYNLNVDHRIYIPFSDDPVLISDILIHNSAKSEVVENLKVIDFWDINLHHILSSVIVTSNNRKKFGKSRVLNGAGKIIKFIQKIFKLDTDEKRRRFDKKFFFNVILDDTNKTIILTPIFNGNHKIKKEIPAKHNYYPKSIFISMLNGNPQKAFYQQEQLYNKKKNQFDLDWEKNDISTSFRIQAFIKNPCLAIGTVIASLEPNEQTNTTCIFGYADINDIPNLIKKYREILSKNSLMQWNAEKWKDSIIELKTEKDFWLARETQWHSYYIRSACYFDEYYNQHKFPQGSIYQFGHGFDGAIRDFILFLNSVIFLDVKLAKEYLIFILSLMEPDGKLPYALYGFGKTLSAFVHSKPSDLYLFLIWGIIQYVYTTRDFNFLNQEISFYPKSLNKSSTVLERINFAINYLFSEKVGFGEHGLIKCNDGDWSDGISLMVKKRKRFIKFGESNFNSTFALFLLPKLIPLLKIHKPELAKSCLEKLDTLKNAVLETWNGKWFFRGFDGLNNPIGNKNIYLEHHTWLLISEILKKEQANALINEIYEILDKPSPIGQYISFPPQKTMLNVLPKGWDVNGGIWHAMNALLTWGYSKYDPIKAYNSLRKNSMSQRAETYPNIWYGIWSGPDSYIADYAENAGQAFYHLPTPMCDFPLMNLNIHACYLLSIIKIVGIEANYDSIIIDPKLNNQDFYFKSPLISIESNNCSLFFNYQAIDPIELNIKIKMPNWWKDTSKVLLNNADITTNASLLSINEGFISIIIENIKTIEIRILL